jgi:hypothetical protein
LRRNPVLIRSGVNQAEIRTYPRGIRVRFTQTLAYTVVSQGIRLSFRSGVRQRLLRHSQSAGWRHARRRRMGCVGLFVSTEVRR